MKVILFSANGQHMGLNSNRSPNLVSAQQWMWLCASAYWQLLLVRDVVIENRPAWFPFNRQLRARLTPYQEQHSALVFCWSWARQPLSPDPLEKAQTGKRIVARHHVVVIRWYSSPKKPRSCLLPVRNCYLLFSF
jgi:hypothetical protein